jgi:hypothetical protein
MVSCDGHVDFAVYLDHDHKTCVMHDLANGCACSAAWTWLSMHMITSCIVHYRQMHAWLLYILSLPLC